MISSLAHLLSAGGEGGGTKPMNPTQTICNIHNFHPSIHNFEKHARDEKILALRHPLTDWVAFAN